MALSFAKNVIHKKDSKGDTYTLAETMNNGEVIQHMTILGSLDKILKGAEEFQKRNDDIWIIGYAKSGIHWVSEVVNTLLVRELTPPFTEAERILEMNSNIESMEKMESPRVLNTYMQVQYLPKHILKDEKMIFVLRNPKSVAVSYYYHHRTFRHYGYQGTFSGFLPTFMEGMDSFYGNWFDMVTGYWKEYKDSPNVYFVVYEELVKNPVGGVSEIAKFLGLDQDVGVFEDVVEKTKFEVMKAREAPALIDNPMVTGTDGIYRKGTTTDWNSHFSDQENDMFDSIYEEKMKDYPDLKEKISFT